MDHEILIIWFIYITFYIDLLTFTSPYNIQATFIKSLRLRAV